jgi:hypothetical protein
MEDNWQPQLTVTQQWQEWLAPIPDGRMPTKQKIEGLVEAIYSPVNSEWHPGMLRWLGHGDGIRSPMIVLLYTSSGNYMPINMAYQPRWLKSSKQVLPSEPAHSRFNPGYWLSWDVSVLFKTYIEIFHKCFPKQVGILPAHFTISSQAARLATCCCGCVACKGEAHTVWQRYWLANRIIIFVCETWHILTNWIWCWDLVIAGWARN